MNRSLVIRAGAKQDIKNAIDWYRAQAGPALGLRFIEEVRRALEKIEENPETWAHWQEDQRYQKVLLEHFPFIVFYKLTPKQIRITAVAHTKKAPGFWVSR